MKNFAEAAVAKKNKDLQRQKDIQKATENMEKGLKAEENKVKLRQINEINHLKNKLKAEYDSLSKEKDKQMGILQKKYVAKIKELNKQHKLENYMNKNNDFAKKIISSTTVLNEENRIPRVKYNKYAPNFNDLEDEKLEKKSVTTISSSGKKGKKNQFRQEDVKTRKFEINFVEVPFEV